MSEGTSRRQNAALCVRATAALEEVKRIYPFAEDRDAARFAFAFALSESVPLERPDLGPWPGGRNWAVGSLDPDGELARVIELTWPTEPDPYYVLETLMNVGILAIADRLREERVPLSDFLPDAGVAS